MWTNFKAKIILSDEVNKIAPPLLARIWSGLEQGYQRSNPHIDLSQIEKVIVKTPQTKIGTDEWGIGGWAISKNHLDIYVDPSHPRFSQDELEERLSATFVEEAHHTVRMSDRGYGKTLAEGIVSEGLAKNFVEETGHPTCFTVAAVSGQELEMIVRTIQNDLYKSYDEHRTLHCEVFFGYNPTVYPKYAGYALGAAIVRGWLDMTNTTAAKAVSVDPKIIMQAWLKKDFVLDFNDTKPQRRVLGGSHSLPVPPV